ncbi:hypothetical protein BMS3Abin03_01250 [bacterium BMS3Abin03]|nr:hypothetical protein BMS3Abin03_01250 [bacterium BMS3Abin03]
MITALIFFLHFIFATIIFTKKWQEEGISSAFMNIVFIAIIFAVGWTITGMVSKLLMNPEGLGIYFDRDTFSLVLLTVSEFFFYKIYYKPPAIEAGKEK